jgi:RNA polymerase sigma-70 factor (ECF subfamily)
MSHLEPERREHAPPGTSLLAGLTPEQAQAVTHGTGPLLLIAGSAEGKTMAHQRWSEGDARRTRAYLEATRGPVTICGLIRIPGDMPGERADAELLGSGAASEFGSFYDRHVNAVTAFVGTWAVRPEVVFDLVAETFARALEHRDQYDPGKGPAVAWLLGIARSLMIDSARRGRVEAASRQRLGMAAVELDDEQLELVADRAKLDLSSALGSIAAEQREAVIRRVVLEQSYGAIAADLRCSEQVVRKRVSRGLAALRGMVEGER